MNLCGFDIVLCIFFNYFFYTIWFIIFSLLNIIYYYRLSFNNYYQLLIWFIIYYSLLLTMFYSQPPSRLGPRFLKSLSTSFKPNKKLSMHIDSFLFSLICRVLARLPRSSSYHSNQSSFKPIKKLSMHIDSFLF